MPIELAGYETVFSGVYATDRALTKKGEVILLKEIILLEGYQLNKEKVVDYVQGKADFLSRVKPGTPGNYDPLDTLILIIPEIIDALKTRRQDLVTPMKKNMPGAVLEVTLSMMPLAYHNEAEKAGEIIDARWYTNQLMSRKLLSQGFGFQWEIPLLYSEEEIKRPSNQINNILRDVRKILKDKRFSNEYIQRYLSDSREVLETVCTAIPTLNELSQLELKVSTPEMIEAQALISMRTFLRNLVTLWKTEQEMSQIALGNKN